MQELLIINIPEIQLQTVFYPGFSKQNITNKILVVGKFDDNHVLYCHKPNFVTAAAWYGLICIANEGQELYIVFPFRRRQEKIICYFAMYFRVGLSILAYYNSIGY